MFLQPLFLEPSDCLVALNVKELILCGAEIRPEDGGQLKALSNIFPNTTSLEFRDLTLGERASDSSCDKSNVMLDLPNSYTSFFESVAALKNLEELRMVKIDFLHVLGSHDKDVQPLSGAEGLKIVNSITAETMAEVKDGHVYVLCGYKTAEPSNGRDAVHQV